MKYADGKNVNSMPIAHVQVADKSPRFADKNALD